MNVCFGERLRSLRTDAGLTQNQLAKKLQTTQRRISHLESGKIEPDLEFLWQVCEYFNTSADYMIGRTET